MLAKKTALHMSRCSNDTLASHVRYSKHLEAISDRSISYNSIIFSVKGVTDAPGGSLLVTNDFLERPPGHYSQYSGYTFVSKIWEDAMRDQLTNMTTMECNNMFIGPAYDQSDVLLFTNISASTFNSICVYIEVSNSSQDLNSSMVDGWSFHKPTAYSSI